MVLDEEALEAMLARGRAAEGTSPPPKMVVADESDDFEVYERKEERPEAAPGVHKEAAPTAASVVAPPVEDFEVYGEEPEAPAAPTPEMPPAATEPEAPPAPEPSPEPAPVAPAGPAVEAAAAPAPQVVEETPPVQASPAETPAPAAQRRRPEVWPPLRRSHAPTPQAQPAPQPAATKAVSGGPGRLGIVHAAFNHEITDRMVQVARQAADQVGAPVTATLQVPGVYDMPLAVKRLLARTDVDAVVVLGVVVQGETKHDELITHATAKTLQELSLQFDKPVGLGITGPGMTWEQAEARIDNAAHAVQAALALLHAKA